MMSLVAGTPALPLFFVTNIGPVQLLIILLLVLLFFGKRLPGMARSLGESFIEFKKGIRSEDQRKDELQDRSEDAKSADARSESKTGARKD